MMNLSWFREPRFLTSGALRGCTDVLGENANIPNLEVLVCREIWLAE